MLIRGKFRGIADVILRFNKEFKESKLQTVEPNAAMSYLNMNCDFYPAEFGQMLV
jgi:hypothetical protein